MTWKQKSLDGSELPLPDGKPPEGACCDACFYAKEKRCTCSCGGAYHGLGAMTNRSERKGARIRKAEPAPDPVLPGDVAELFMAQAHDFNCGCQGGDELRDEPVHYYPHEAGWKVPGFDQLLWLYIRCPYCGNDMSLWKIGVHRDFTPVQEATH